MISTHDSGKLLTFQGKSCSHFGSFTKIVSNLHPCIFGVKVRHRSPRPSICVRTFTLFTIWATTMTEKRRFIKKHLAQPLPWTVRKLDGGVLRSSRDCNAFVRMQLHFVMAS